MFIDKIKSGKLVWVFSLLAILASSWGKFLAQDSLPENVGHSNRQANQSGNISEAESYLLRAIEAAKTLPQPDTRLPAALCDLARLYVGQAKYSKAETLFKQVSTIYVKNLGAEHADVADIKNSLAEVYRLEGRFMDAELLLKEALAIDEVNLATNPEYVARDLNNLGKVYLDEDKYADAEPLLKRALSIKKEYFAPEDPDVAYTMLNYVRALKHLNRLAEAEAMEQEARKILAQP